jgi:putative pyruvate formate lyase activating enzyme
LSGGVFVCGPPVAVQGGDILSPPQDIDGRLEKQAQRARDILRDCVLCPRECHVNRLGDQRGFCQVGARAVVSSVGPHFGEEAPLVGSHGSGTIFFAGCNLGCLFCQNYDISHLVAGEEVSEEELAQQMWALQRLGCHNINLVTPTHTVPQILGALARAQEEGMDLPVVYNCGGYESVQTLKLLEGAIDIYMPDFKYGDNESGKRYSCVDDYFDRACQALVEMHRQVGDLITDPNGIAQRGLLIRHLVLPQDLAGTDRVMDFIAREISTDSYVNIMAQYRPEYRAAEFPELDRRITAEEYLQAVEIARGHGITRLDRA